MIMVMIIIRVLLSLLLLYGVYTETGIFTTLSMGLTMLAFELVIKKWTRW